MTELRRIHLNVDMKYCMRAPGDPQEWIIWTTVPLEDCGPTVNTGWLAYFLLTDPLRGYRYVVDAEAYFVLGEATILQDIVDQIKKDPDGFKSVMAALWLTAPDGVEVPESWFWRHVLLETVPEPRL